MRLASCTILALTACGSIVDLPPTPSSLDASAGILDASNEDAKEEAAADVHVDSPSSCDPCDPDAGGDPAAWYCTAAHQWSVCDPTTPTSGTGCLLHYACDAGGQ
jgi:hypothetical protein